MFRRDFFPAPRSFITRDCMDTSVILSIFSYTWYWLQNRIFLTVSENYWILNRKIQAGIRQTCIFRTPLGGLSCSHHMVENFGRLIMLLANTPFPSTDIKKLSRVIRKSEVQSAWEFLLHGSLLYTAGEIQDFLPRFFPCSSKFYYKGLYGHISDFEHFS